MSAAGFGGGARAQQPVAAPAPAAQQMTAVPATGLLDISADSLSYDSARRVVVARGNVIVTRGTDSVRADYAEVDTANEQVSARGNILIQYQGNTWKGEQATYNFRTGTGDFGVSEFHIPPYYLTARDSRRLSPQLIRLEGVMLTTCEPDSPEYSVRASSATLENQRTLRARNIRFQLGPVPFFWFPYIKADVDSFANFEFTPGWSSAMGPFLLTTYHHPINETFRTRTHFDVRQRRGIGIGEDLLWKDPAAADYAGQLRLYYTQDRKPWHGEIQRKQREALIDEHRYWIHLADRRNLTDRDTWVTLAHYVSDPWMLSDFFDDEYQRNVQPENRMTLTHRGDGYNAGIGLNVRLNEFYENVNRLPEVFLNINRQPIGNTPLYYESENTLAYLNRVFPDQSSQEEYSTFRLDSSHMAYWPMRYFGFLSLIPRAGYRGTYYSKTREAQMVTNVVVVTNNLGEVIGTTNVVETLVRDGPAGWRNLPELGLESSFKAFGRLYDGPTGIEEDRDLRHVLEPYANYTFRPEPNLLPEELWTFDAVDKLRDRNDVGVGVRNYLQTRRQNSVHDLIYADVFTTLYLDPDEDEQTLGDLGFKTELRPWSWLSWDFDGSFDTRQNELQAFGTQVQVENEDIFTVGLDYRYKRDKRQAAAADVVVFPEAPWSARVYARMDLDASHVEEHSYYLLRRTRCLGIGLGLRVRPDQTGENDDNYTIWFRIWPLAFPQYASSLGG